VLDILLLGICLFRSKMADLARKVYERKSVAPAQQTDNERKEILAGIAAWPCKWSPLPRDSQLSC